MFLPNNSRVLLSDIGEGSSALFCLTDREACCSFPNRGALEFPDGRRIGRSSSSGIYFGKGSSSIQLNRRSSATGPTGKFTCLIPREGDDFLAVQTLFIGIFNETEGTASVCALLYSHWFKYSSSDPTITSTVSVTGGGGNFEVGENTSLSCDVSGTDNLVDPTLTYLWLRDNITIPDMVEATLMLDPLRTIDSGSYSCRVTVSDVFLLDPIIHTSSGVNINVRG